MVDGEAGTTAVTAGSGKLDEGGAVVAFSRYTRWRFDQKLVNAAKGDNGPVSRGFAVVALIDSPIGPRAQSFFFPSIRPPLRSAWRVLLSPQSSFGGAAGMYVPEVRGRGGA
jgi:hypothetical protein